jgi:hypothetical protein
MLAKAFVFSSLGIGLALALALDLKLYLELGLGPWSGPLRLGTICAELGDGSC